METIGITAPIYGSATIATRSQTRLHLHETTRASVADVELPHFLTVFVAGPTVPAKRLPRDWRSDTPDIDPVYFSCRTAACIEVVGFSIRSRVPLEVAISGYMLCL
jgi:hypothetical protein